MFNRVKQEDILMFTKHMVTMITAGIPLAESLDLAVEQTQHKKFKTILESVTKDVRSGSSFSDALSEHPREFDNLYIQLIAVGEQSGTLEESLRFLSEQVAISMQFRKKVQAALMYPGLVLIATSIMGGFISFFILPQLVEFFESFDTTLPLATRVLIRFAHTIENYGVLLVLAAALLAVLTRMLLRVASVKVVWDTYILQAPVVGKLLAHTQYARFSRNLGILIKSGIPVSESLEIVTESMSNTKLKNDVLYVANQLAAGTSLGGSFEESDHSFPPLLTKMIAVGEKSGSLDDTLLYLAEFFETEIDSISKNLSTVLEPILLLTIGLVVGFVALAIISPIYGLTGSIR